MINIPSKTEAPLTRDTVLSLNGKRVRGALSSRDISELNRPAPSASPAGPQAGNPAPVQGRPQAGNPTPVQGGPGGRGPAQAPAGHAAPPPQRIFPALVKPVQKGQKIVLGGGAVRKIRACMGWNVSSANCDADVSAFLLSNEKVPGDDWFVFYGQHTSPDRSTVFSPNASPDRESISVDFTKLNPAVDRIVFILTIDEAAERNLNFSMIRDAYIRILDDSSGQELVSFRVDAYYPNVISMTIGEVYLHKGQWKFSAVGNGVGKDLAGLCQLYGVQVE